MPNCYPEERETWAVQVYRYTTSKGWEMYQDAVSPPTIERERSRSTKSKISPEQPSKQPEPITAAPKKGCVEVRKLRLRIHLFHQPPKKTGKCGKENATSEKNESSASTSAKIAVKSSYAGIGWHTTVIRRRDTILLSTPRGFGAVVLKFRCISDCIAFSDRLVSLNVDYAVRKDNKAGDSCATKEKIGIPAKRLKPSEHRGLSTSDKVSMSVSPCNDEMSHASGKKNNILSYVVRLLHDDDFLNFVDDVEGSLASATEDCSGILKALEYPRATRAPSNSG